MKKFIFTLISVLSLTMFLSCQNDDDISKEPIITRNSGDIIIGSDGLIKSPEWLAYTVDTVAARYVTTKDGKLIGYPFVYYIEYEGIGYYIIRDGINATIVYGKMVFTNEGEKIEFNSDLYNIIVEGCINTGNLVWWPLEYIYSLDTKALGAAANIRTPNGSLVSDTYYSTEEHNSNTRHQDTLMYRNIFPEV